MTDHPTPRLRLVDDKRLAHSIIEMQAALAEHRASAMVVVDQWCESLADSIAEAQAIKQLEMAPPGIRDLAGRHAESALALLNSVRAIKAKVRG